MLQSIRFQSLYKYIICSQCYTHSIFQTVTNVFSFIIINNVCCRSRCRCWNMEAPFFFISNIMLYIVSSDGVFSKFIHFHHCFYLVILKVKWIEMKTTKTIPFSNLIETSRFLNILYFHQILMCWAKNWKKKKIKESSQHFWKVCWSISSIKIS